METNLTDISQRIRHFIEERDWSQFHDPKDLAISLNLEAAEVLEHFQWKNAEEIDSVAIGKELADVLYWIVLMSSTFGIDLSEAFENKMQENEIKYPVDKAKGNKSKYTKLIKEDEQI